jgi:polar amino acid transport system permease protein
MAKLKLPLIIIAAFLIAFTVLAFFKPPVAELAARISPQLKDSAGIRYSENTYDFIFMSMARGKNVRTAEQDTYLGIAGIVIRANGGAIGQLGDMLFWMPQLVSGARITLSLTVLAVASGIFLSVFLALGTISRNKIFKRLCGAYIFFFRGTPLLMQLFFIYYGLPQINPALTISDRFLAAYIAFTLNSAAYCSEIIRAAIQSIEKGQFEASRALGLNYAQTMVSVIIPQSIRRLIPPVANEFIMVVKDASLVSIIALTDLTHTTQSISTSASTVLVYIPAMVIYLIITAFFTYLFKYLEKRFSIY